jgi:hypothetical protein
MDDNDTRALLTTLHAYISERDNPRSSFRSSTPGPFEFSAMIDAYAAQVALHLPRLNLAELQALCELLNSRLSTIRHAQDPNRSN